MISFFSILIFFFIFFLPIILCLLLIEKKNYKKLSKSQKYAGFWFRFLAGVVDAIILVLISFPIYLIFSFIAPLIDIIVSWLYFVLLQSSKSQATLGMRVCGIKIYDEQFHRLGFWRLTGRYWSTWLSAIILFIGFFMIGFTRRKQGLHDIIARTIHLKD